MEIMHDSMDHSLKKILRQAKKAFDHKHTKWDDLLEDIWRYTVPERMDPNDYGDTPDSLDDEIFDSTAVQAMDSLANSLIAGLTPPWNPFYKIVAGPAIPKESRGEVEKNLAEITKMLFLHLNLSNFTQEIQPAYLDVIASTGAITIEPNPSGEGFTFQNVPLSELMFYDVDGKMDHIFRKHSVRGYEILEKFEDVLKGQERAHEFLKSIEENPTRRHVILSIVVPDERNKGKFRHIMVPEKMQDHVVLKDVVLKRNPYIVFRWSRIPGTPLGRGPAMRAIHDIRYLNKIKEFALDNAAMASAGVWTGADDGLFNPYTVHIEPGIVVPVSSNDSNAPSLRPLEVGSNFNIAQFMLETMRSDVKKMFFADRFGNIDGPKMTATEVIQRSRVIAQELSSTFGRLQTELLIPLVQKMISILADQGVIDPIEIDGKNLDVVFVSPLAQAQELEKMDNLMQWVTITQQLGQFDPRAALAPDYIEVIKKSAKMLQVDLDVLRSDQEIQTELEAAQAAQQAQAQQQGVVSGQEQQGPAAPGPNQ